MFKGEQMMVPGQEKAPEPAVEENLEEGPEEEAEVGASVESLDERMPESPVVENLEEVEPAPVENLNERVDTTEEEPESEIIPAQNAREEDKSQDGKGMISRRDFIKGMIGLGMETAGVTAAVEAIAGETKEQALEKMGNAKDLANQFVGELGTFSGMKFVSDVKRNYSRIILAIDSGKVESLSLGGSLGELVSIYSKGFKSLKPFPDEYRKEAEELKGVMAIVKNTPLTEVKEKVKNYLAGK